MKTDSPDLYVRNVLDKAYIIIYIIKTVTAYKVNCKQLEPVFVKVPNIVL